MKKSLSLFIASSILLLNSARAQEKFTLEQCVNYALEHNLTIKQAAFNMAITEEDLTESKYNLLPSINGQASQNFNKGRNINPQTNLYVDQSLNSTNLSLNAEVVLFSGLQKLNLIKQNKYSLMSQQSNVEKIKQDITLNVVSEFLTTLFNQELVRNYENQLTVSQGQVEVAKKKADVGSITEADFLQFKAQQSVDEFNLTTAQSQLTISLLNLRQLLSIDADKPFEIVRPSEVELMNIETKYNSMAVYSEALKINPEIKRLEYQRMASEKSLSVAKGGYLPTLSLGGYYSTNYSSLGQKTIRTPLPDAPTGLYIPGPGGNNVAVYGPDASVSFSDIGFSEQIKNNLGSGVGFTLRVPIFNGLQIRTGVRKSKINYENSVINEQFAKNTLNKTVTQAVVDLNAAEKKFASASTSFESLKKAYEYSQKRFDVGLINSLDLNIAKTNYSKAESEALQAKYDMIFKSKVIDYYLGKPLTL
ncbi:TolC family protein [Solitalea longa]|uniref:TolC family protein n=1 Tax=Solitalea longa TaxID=2079460 RepID=UPI0013FD4DC6|nr:TolC family protein [Solitalea longa]